MNEDTREILLILQEECAEVTQAISKCFRFGPDQIKPGKDCTNIQMLQEELGEEAEFDAEESAQMRHVRRECKKRITV
jgi:NTP pyrophosphatase (non-canonical NTP hydrolase)